MRGSWKGKEWWEEKLQWKSQCVESQESFESRANSPQVPALETLAEDGMKTSSQLTKVRLRKGHQGRGRGAPARESESTKWIQENADEEERGIPRRAKTGLPYSSFFFFSRSQASLVGLLKIYSSGQNPLQSSVKLLKAGTCSDCPQRWHTGIIFKTNRAPEFPSCSHHLSAASPSTPMPSSFPSYSLLLSFISSGDPGDEH